MTQSFFASTGIWFWWIVGMVLIGIEILAPGTFFLWFGLAAFVVGALTMILGTESAIWGWQVQVITFAVLAIVFAVAGRRLMTKQGWDESDRPDLNQRGKQLIGRQAVVSEPITGGAGRAKIGETTWRVTGPDLPKGAAVKIIDAEAETLIVEAVGD